MCVSAKCVYRFYIVNKKKSVLLFKPVFLSAMNKNVGAFMTCMGVSLSARVLGG